MYTSARKLVWVAVCLEIISNISLVSWKGNILLTQLVILSFMHLYVTFKYGQWQKDGTNVSLLCIIIKVLCLLWCLKDKSQSKGKMVKGKAFIFESQNPKFIFFVFREELCPKCEMSGRLLLLLLLISSANRVMISINFSYLSILFIWAMHKPKNSGL